MTPLPASARPVAVAVAVVCLQAILEGGKLREWVAGRVRQQAFAAMPVGLLFDSTTFPHHSKVTKAWEAARAARHRRPALTDSQTQ